MTSLATAGARVGPDARGLAAAAIGVAIASWWLRSEAFIADDSYFYPVIARNLALEGRQTFSGVVATNGFHPLWLYLLAAYSEVVAWWDPSALYRAHYAVPLSAIVFGVGFWAWLRVAARLRLSPWCVVGIPAVFLLAFGVLYSEAHALWATLGLLCAELAQPTGARPGRAGLLCGLVLLARLDALFFVPPLALFLLRPLRWNALVRFGAGLSIPVLPYLASNAIFFGGLMPVSGWMKSSFPAVYWKGFAPAGLASGLFGYSVVFGIVPLLAALVVAFRLGSTLSPPRRRVFTMLLGGALLHFAYVALFTRSHTLWYWYYVPSVVTGALALAIVAETPASRWRDAAVAALLALTMGTLLADRWRHDRTNPRSLALQAFAQGLPADATLLVSDYPGRTAFFSRARVMQVDLLMANRPFYDEMRRAPDALAFLFERCRAAGHPITHVAYVAGPWLVPSADGRTLVYHDPRAYPALVPIGVLALRSPPRRLAGRADALVWELPRARG